MVYRYSSRLCNAKIFHAMGYLYKRKGTSAAKSVADFRIGATDDRISIVRQNFYAAAVLGC